MTHNIELGDDIIDSRDVIERITDLKEQLASELNEYDDREELETELAAWQEFASQGETVADWQYGEAFILDGYFETYAQELAEDIGAIDRDAPWPASYIDWGAATEALQQDYTSIEVAGYTYWAR